MLKDSEEVVNNLLTPAMVKAHEASCLRIKKGLFEEMESVLIGFIYM